jgi:hypothetical protein
LVLCAPLATAFLTASARGLSLERADEARLLDDWRADAERDLDGDRFAVADREGFAAVEREGERFAAGERLVEGRDPPDARDVDWAIAVALLSGLPVSAYPGLVGGMHRAGLFEKKAPRDAGWRAVARSRPARQPRRLRTTAQAGGTANLLILIANRRAAPQAPRTTYAGAAAPGRE